MILSSRKRKLWNEIEAYRNKLASSKMVTPDETVRCHTALLYLGTNREAKIRSIQTLATLHEELIISPTIRELAALSKEWPNETVNGWPRILLGILKEFPVD